MKLSRRATIFIITFIVLTIIMGYASTLTINRSDAQSLIQSIEAIPITTLSIFLNNVQVALIEFIPGVGPVYGGISAYETGLVLAATGELSPTGVTGLESFVFLLFTPTFWLEFFCYSLAVEESVAVIISFKNRDFLKNEWKWLVSSILVVVSVLLISARLEVELINLLK